MKRSATGLVSLLIWIVIWQLASVYIANEIFLPKPSSVFRALFVELLPSRTFWASITTSVANIGLGFALGCLCGTLFAWLAAWRKSFYMVLWFPLKAIKAIPVASFVVLALLWIDSSKLSVLIPFLMVLPTIYINTLTGIRKVDAKLLEMASVFQLSVGKKVWYIYLPQVLPYFLSGCSLAIGMAWKSGIAAEIIGLSRNTIGNQLYQTKIYLLTPELFAWTLVIVLLSVFCEMLIKQLLKTTQVGKEQNNGTDTD